MFHGIRTCLTQVGIIFTDEPFGQKLHGQSCRRWKRQVRPVSPHSTQQVPGALPCLSHLTCRPLCTPGWPRCTRGGGSGPAARCWLGVCRTSRTSSVLRERAGGRGAPAAVSDGDLLTVVAQKGSAAPGWEIPSLPSSSWSQAGWHPHPTVVASIPPKEKDPPALCAPITPQKEKRNAASHLKTQGRRGRGAVGERGAGPAAVPARPGLR